MDLQEAADMATTIAGGLENDAMAAIEAAVGQVEELDEFVEQLHTVLSNEESGGVHQIRAELAEACTTAMEAASAAQEKASTLAGALASMRDR